MAFILQESSFSLEHAILCNPSNKNIRNWLVGDCGPENTEGTLSPRQGSLGREKMFWTLIRQIYYKISTSDFLMEELWCPGEGKVVLEFIQEYLLTTGSMNNGPNVQQGWGLGGGAVALGCYLHSLEEMKILPLMNNSLLKCKWIKWVLLTPTLIELYFTEFQNRIYSGHLKMFSEQQF